MPRRFFILFNTSRERLNPRDKVPRLFDARTRKQNLLKGKRIFELEFGILKF